MKINMKNMKTVLERLIKEKGEQLTTLSYTSLSYETPDINYSSVKSSNTGIDTKIYELFYIKEICMREQIYKYDIYFIIVSDNKITFSRLFSLDEFDKLLPFDAISA